MNAPCRIPNPMATRPAAEPCSFGTRETIFAAAHQPEPEIIPNDRNRASAGLIDASALSAVPAAARRTHAVSALQELVDELQPLAAARMQSFRLHAAPALQWEAPREAVETLLANLLLNAVQHGGAGMIEVEADATHLTICNPPTTADAPGFGLGLDIARRLAARMGWLLEMRASDQRVCCELRWSSYA